MTTTHTTNQPALINTSPIFLEAPTSSVVRFGGQIEELLLIGDQISKHLDSYDQLHAAGFYVHLNNERFALEIKIELCDTELGIVKLTSGLDDWQITADTILQNLEGGRPGTICFSDWSSMVEWICELVVRLLFIEEFWSAAAISRALADRAKP